MESGGVGMPGVWILHIKSHVAIKAVAMQHIVFTDLVLCGTSGVQHLG